MYGLDNASGVNVMPKIAPVASATPLWFTEGGAGLAASYPGQDWFNMVQAELLAVLTAGGVKPEKGKLNQLAEAIGKIVSGGKYATEKQLSDGLALKFDKTSVVQTVGSSTASVISQDGATKAFQPKGNYQPAGSYANGTLFGATKDYTRIQSPSLSYRAVITDSGSFMVINDATSGQVFGFSPLGELTSGKIPFERLTGVSTDANGIVRTGNSTALTTADRTVSLGTSATLVATQKLVNDVNSKLIGVGQIWQHMHVTGERKANVVYTNDKGRAIEISVTYRAESGNNLAALTVKINGYAIARQVSRYSDAEKTVNITLIIPAGATYEVTEVNGTLYLWSELS